MTISNEAADFFDTIPSKVNTTKKSKTTIQAHKSKNANGVGDITMISSTELYQLVDKATDDYITKHLDSIKTVCS